MTEPVSTLNILAVVMLICVMAGVVALAFVWTPKDTAPGPASPRKRGGYVYGGGDGATGGSGSACDGGGGGGGGGDG